MAVATGRRLASACIRRHVPLMTTTRILGALLLPFGLAACEIDTVPTDLEDKQLRVDSRMERLVIHNDGGTIDVMSSPLEDSIRVTASLHRIEWQSVSETWKNLDYDLSASGSRAVLRAKLDDVYGWVDIRVVVPEDLAVEIHDGSGDIEVKGVSDVVIDDESGDIFASWISGSVDIVDDSGDIELSQIGGDIRILDDSGKIRAFDVGGHTSIEDGSGDVELRDLLGPANILDGSGDLYIERGLARVEIRDGSGDISLVETPDAWILSDGGGDVRRR